MHSERGAARWAWHGSGARCAAAPHRARLVARNAPLHALPSHHSGGAQHAAGAAAAEAARAAAATRTRSSRPQQHTRCTHPTQHTPSPRVTPPEYRLVAKKGEGTFSEVLKAQCVRTGKYVAIKCMKNKFESMDQVRADSHRI